MAGERKFINENVRRLLLKEFLRNKVSRAGFGGLDIQRTPLGTRVKLIIERPGLVIGKKGAAIRDLTAALEKEFNFDHPQIEVEEVKNSSLNAHIMAYKLAESLERGWHFRRAGHSTVRRIMEAGAVGCQIVISGKLTGQRHRVEKFKDGHIKFCGEPRVQWVQEGFAVATVKLGTIGVKVQITHPDTKLPDEITVYDSIPEEKEEAPAEEKAEAKEKPPEKKRARKSRSSKKKDDKNGKQAEKKNNPAKVKKDKKVPSEKKEEAKVKKEEKEIKEESSVKEVVAEKKTSAKADEKKTPAKVKKDKEMPSEKKEDAPVKKEDKEIKDERPVKEENPPVKKEKVESPPVSSEKAPKEEVLESEIEEKTAAVEAPAPMETSKEEKKDVKPASAENKEGGDTNVSSEKQ